MSEQTYETIEKETFDIHILKPSQVEEIDEIIKTDKAIGMVYVDNGTETKEDDSVIYVTRK